MEARRRLRQSFHIRAGALAMSGQLDTIVRFHDVSRIPELKRAVFSLVCQSYRPLHIILATQRFSEEDIAATQAALAPILENEPAVFLSVANMTDEEPKDGRSVLLNRGMAYANGR